MVRKALIGSHKFVNKHPSLAEIKNKGLLSLAEELRHKETGKQ